MNRRRPVISTGGDAFRFSGLTVRSDSPNRARPMPLTVRVEDCGDGVWRAECGCGWHTFFASALGAREAAKDHGQLRRRTCQPPSDVPAASPAAPPADSSAPRMIVSRSSRSVAPASRSTKSAKGNRVPRRSGDPTKPKPKPPKQVAPAGPSIRSLAAGWSVTCSKCRWPGAAARTEDAAKRLAAGHRCSK
jgi:hypothetical protein